MQKASLQVSKPHASAIIKFTMKIWRVKKLRISSLLLAEKYLFGKHCKNLWGKSEKIGWVYLWIYHVFWRMF
jgi:hypothetical protein